MRVSKTMTKDVAHCRSADSLDVAAHLLWKHDCGAAPVVDESGAVQGVITDRDICMAAWSTGKELSALRVGDVMSRDVASIGEMDTLLEAEMVMRSRRVHRLPVLDDRKRLVGMLCCNDLLRWVDDGGAPGSAAGHAAHLVHTLATIGRSRAVELVARPAAVTIRNDPVDVSISSQGCLNGLTAVPVADHALTGAPRPQADLHTKPHRSCR